MMTTSYKHLLPICFSAPTLLPNSAARLRPSPVYWHSSFTLSILFAVVSLFVMLYIPPFLLVYGCVFLDMLHGNLFNTSIAPRWPVRYNNSVCNSIFKKRNINAEIRNNFFIYEKFGKHKSAAFQFIKILYFVRVLFECSALVRPRF